MVRLLTSMKKQISPTAHAVSTFVSDNDRSRTEDFDGASYNPSSEVESGENQHKNTGLFVKPRVEASLIKRHLNSSKVVEDLSPKFSDETESVSALTGKYSHSRASSLMQAPSNLSKKEGAEIGINHSSAKVQGFGHKKQQSIHRKSDSSSTANVEFPCSTCVSVTSNCACGAQQSQCDQKSECVIPAFPRKVVGQTIREGM